MPRSGRHDGIDPGFSGDTLVHTAVSLTTRVSSITVQEIFDNRNYDDPEFTGVAMGFGTTADDEPAIMFLPGVIVAMWGGQVRSLADHLDIKLDEVLQRVIRPFRSTDAGCISTAGRAVNAIDWVCSRAPRARRRGGHPTIRNDARPDVERAVTDAGLTVN